MGIRLEAGTAFGGAVVTPFYDSLLVKVTAHGLRFLDAARHMERCLQEFRIRGVKVNIPFLLNVVTHPDFLAGPVTTHFIDDSPELFQLARRYATEHAGLFSLEMWGGATFDTALRFLKEDPWARLLELRERIPNLLFQMLLRANNAVGYANYPDNVVRAFVKESARAGIDLFRIFDALNWLPNLRLAVEAVREAGQLCGPALRSTGH